MVLALLTPVAMVLGGPTSLRQIAPVASGVGPSPAFAPSEVWDGGNLAEGCPMCTTASTASTVSQPSTDPSRTVDPATGDLSESYTMAAIPDPGGGELNLTLMYDGESAAEQQAQGQLPAPWGYGWSDTGGACNLEVDAAGRQLDELLGTSGALNGYAELVLGPGPTTGSTAVYYATEYTAVGGGEQLTGIITCSALTARGRSDTTSMTSST